VNSPAGWKASITQAKARREIATIRNEAASTEVTYSNILVLVFAIEIPADTTPGVKLVNLFVLGQKVNRDLELSLEVAPK
jgi:hypothetical protein